MLDRYLVRRTLAGSAPTSTDVPFTNVATNSANVQPGDLFVALLGARNGHDFVAAAVAAGATGVVVSQPVSLPAHVEVFHVVDTLQALRDLAEAVRSLTAVDTIAITGSVGKTTTKDVLVHVLSALGRRTLGSPKSFNNHLGVPLTLLMLDGQDDLIAEVGTNRPGEIADLAALIRPRVALVTNIGHAHLGNFTARDALADEKAALFTAVAPDGVWLINADDQLLVDATTRLPRSEKTRVISYGTQHGADVQVSNISVTPTGTSGDLTINGHALPFTIPLIGRHFALTVAAVVAIAVERGLAADAAIAAIATFPGSIGRASISQHGRIRLIDDSYNGSPDSMLAALETLSAVPEQRRFAVLGEMRELGAFSDDLHYQVGAEAGRVATDLLFIGPSLSLVREAAVTAGMEEARFHAVDSATEAAALLLQLIRDEPEPIAVLVKGSRFIHTERVTLAIEGHEIRCELPMCELYIHCRTCANL